MKVSIPLFEVKSPSKSVALLLQNSTLRRRAVGIQETNLSPVSLLLDHHPVLWLLPSFSS